MCWDSCGSGPLVWINLAQRNRDCRTREIEGNRDATSAEAEKPSRGFRSEMEWNRWRGIRGARLLRRKGQRSLDPWNPQVSCGCRLLRSCGD